MLVHSSCQAGSYGAHKLHALYGAGCGCEGAALTMPDTPSRKGKVSLCLLHTTESAPAATMDMPTTLPTIEWVVLTGSCVQAGGGRGALNAW
jgi:hypothetical protein